MPATPDRWAPWIEGREKPANQDITTATPTIVSSLSFTFTPHVNSRGLFAFSLDAENVGAANSQLVGDLYVNGTLTQNGPAPLINVGMRRLLVFDFYVDFTKATTYTVDLRCWCAGALTTHRINGIRTHSQLLVLPNLHA